MGIRFEGHTKREKRKRMAKVMKPKTAEILAVITMGLMAWTTLVLTSSMIGFPSMAKMTVQKLTASMMMMLVMIVMMTIVMKIISPANVSGKAEKTEKQNEFGTELGGEISSNSGCWSTGMMLMMISISIAMIIIILNVIV
jgi:small-conductance mechanosensitive channel